MSRSGEPRIPRSARPAGWLLAAIVLVLGVLLPAAPASAHAVLVDSQPADGAMLTSAPRMVVLRFSEDISAQFSSARLLDGAGRPVPGTRLDPAGGGARRLALALPPLSGATYGVAWRVLAEDDGHTTSGVVVFTVGNTARSPGGQAFQALDSGGGIAPFDAARRWFGLCLLAGLIGGMAFAAVVLRPRRMAPARAALEAARWRVLSVASACGALVALVGLADLLAQAGRSGAGGPSLMASLLVDTRWGHLWVSREAVVVTLAVLAYALRSPAPGRLDRARWITAGALGVLIVTFDGLGGHAASVGSARTVAVVAVAAHALTGYVWLGGLAALVVTAAAPGGMALVRGVRGRFGALAAGSVGLVVATGLYSAGVEVGSAGALTGTAYGRALLVKGVLVLAVGGLGLANAARLRGWPPRFTRPPSRRLLAAEAVAGAVLLFAVGVLVETSPSRVDGARPGGAPVPVMSSGAVQDIVVSVSVTPDRPGSNGFTVIAASGRRPPPAPIDRVTLRLDGYGTVALQEIEPGRYFGTADLPAGTIRATAVVDRAGKQLTVPLTWPVRPPAPVPKEPVNDLAPVTNAAAAAMLLALLGLGAWRLARLRRRRHAIRPADVEPLILEDVR